MVDRSVRRKLSVTTVDLAGAEMLPLDGEPTIRFVESGSVAVFCSEMRAGSVAGPQQFVARVGMGQAVVSAPAPEADGLRLVLRPIEDAVLTEIPLGTASTPAGARLFPAVESWVDRLVTLLPNPAPPAGTLETTGTGEYPLEKGQALRAPRGTLLWARVAEGSVHCMGREELVLDPTSGSFPLGAGLWVSAAAHARLALTTGDEAVVRDGVARLHALVLANLRRTRVEREGKERARLEQRERAQKRELEGALTDLASVLDPQERELADDAPLLAAAAAVGRAIGVEIHAPARFEDLERVADPLDAIARASRVRTRRVLLTGNWWKRDCGPLLAFMADDERRPVALLPTPRLRYEIVDPVSDERTPVTSARTAERLAPEAYTFYRPLPDGRLRITELIRFALQPHGRDLRLILTTGIIATLIGMLTPAATALLVNHAIPYSDTGLLGQIAIGLLAAALGQAAFRLAQGFVLLRIEIAAFSVSQTAVWDRLLRLRPSFFREYSSGDLLSRLMVVNDIARVVSGATLRTAFSSLLALLNLGLLFYFSPPLAWIALGVALVALLSTAALSASIRSKTRVLSELEGRFFGLIVQLVSGVSKLRVAGAENRAYTRWIRLYTEQLKLRSQTQRLEDGVQVLNQALPTVAAIVLFVTASNLLRTEGGEPSLTLGTFLAFSVAFGTFLAGATELSNTVVGVLDAFTRGRGLRPILDAEPEEDSTKADPGRLEGRIALQNIEFRYRPDGAKVLDEVTLRAEPGEFIALVGPSGSGKSTILRLLLGFETPQSGTVSYDGQDISTLDVVGVRRQLGVVLQEGRLNTGSIFDNIACGALITLDEAWAAAEDAGFADDVRAMPMGMHTIVSEGGGNVSGGQRQRLLIARALALRPRILLFDEATSALDNKTQAIVSGSLERLRVTRVVIAHRLSTIKRADRIYVLDEGRVVQQGEFEELLEQKGLFARLMTRQMA